MDTLWSDDCGQYLQYEPKTGEFSLHTNYKKCPICIRDNVEKGLERKDAIATVNARVKAILSGQTNEKGITIIPREQFSTQLEKCIDRIGDHKGHIVLTLNREHIDALTSGSNLLYSDDEYTAGVYFEE
jgi:hypothetical protein